MRATDFSCTRVTNAKRAKVLATICHVTFTNNAMCSILCDKPRTFLLHIAWKLTTISLRMAMATLGAGNSFLGENLYIIEIALFLTTNLI